MTGRDEDRPRNGGAGLAVLTMLLFAASLLVSLQYDNAWVAIVGIAISSMLFSIVGRDEENPEKTEGVGFSVFISAMSIWMGVYVFINI